MRGARFFGLLTLLLSATGCSLTSLAERERAIAVNDCGSEQSCPSGSYCSEDRCVAESGTLSTLLFALSASADQLAGQQLFRTASVRPDGGRFTLDLDGVSRVTGTVQASAAPGCAEATDFRGPDSMESLRRSRDESIPVRLTFHPIERMLGLPVSSSTTVSKLTGGGMVPDTYPFRLQLPAGRYDVYIQPFDVVVTSLEVAPEGCALPPELIRGALFDGEVLFSHRMPLPAHLDLKVKWTDRATTLEGWVVDMLEPVTGRVISTRAPLSLPTDTVDALVYSVGLDYLPVLENDQQVTGNEIVRLSPPDPTKAPSVLFQRSALELFAKGQGVIDQLAAVPNPVSLEGQVIDVDSGAAQRANVTLTATELLGMPAGTLTAFTRSVQTREDGTFVLDVLPGTYRVLTIPAQDVNAADAPFAANEVTWKIAASPARQAGRAVALSRARAVTGAVFTPWEDPARGVSISVEPSPGTIVTDVFARAIGELPLVPRSTTSGVSDNGAFELFADPGTPDKPNLFDLSVRPPTASGFPWLLLPRLELGEDTVNVGELQLASPVQLELTAELRGNSQSGDLLSGANLRVYALLDAEGKPTNDAALAKSAVAIAESALDSDARAKVLLPPALGKP